MRGHFSRGGKKAIPHVERSQDAICNEALVGLTARDFNDAAEDGVSHAGVEPRGSWISDEWLCGNNLDNLSERSVENSCKVEIASGRSCAIPAVSVRRSSMVMGREGERGAVAEETLL